MLSTLCKVCSSTKNLSHLKWSTLTKIDKTDRSLLTNQCCLPVKSAEHLLYIPRNDHNLIILIDIRWLIDITHLLRSLRIDR